MTIAVFAAYFAAVGIIEEAAMAIARRPRKVTTYRKRYRKHG